MHQYTNNRIIGVFDANYPWNQHQDGVQTSGDYIAIYGNYFENQQNYPIYGDWFGSVSHWRVYNNVFNGFDVPAGVPWQAIALGFEGTSGAVANDIIVANNTVYYSGPGGSFIAVGGGWAGNTVTNGYVVNNLLYNSDTYLIPGSGGSIVSSNNYAGTSAINFASATTGDFHILAGSTNAIDRGISPSCLTSFFTTDADGTTRPQGSAWDIGAYEYAGGGGGDTTPPTNPTSLTANVVSSSQINLSWNASTDNVGVTGYQIYRGGTQVSTSATNSYSVSGSLPPP